MGDGESRARPPTPVTTSCRSPSSQTPVLPSSQLVPLLPPLVLLPLTLQQSILRPRSSELLQSLTLFQLPLPLHSTSLEPLLWLPAPWLSPLLLPPYTDLGNCFTDHGNCFTGHQTPPKPLNH